MATAKMFGQYLMKVLNNESKIPASGATNLYVMLLTSAQATALTDGTAQDSWAYKNSITSEVSGTGYTATGKQLQSVTCAYTAGTNTITVDAADVTWSTSTITARFAVIYDNTGASDANRCLIAWVDFGGNVSSSAGDFTLQWDTNGIFTISTSA